MINTLASIESERQVSAALYRYARALDDRDWGLLDTVFTDDATASYGGNETLSGRANIVGGIRHYLDGCGPTQHLIGNIEVTQKDVGLASRCAVRAVHASGDATPLWSFGSYEAAWSETDAGWRVRHWSMQVGFNYGDPAVFGKTPATGALTTEDWAAIQGLVHRYPLLLDAGRLDELGRLFAEADVYFESLPEPVRNDPARITAMFRDFVQLYDGSPRTRHQMANLIIEADGPGRARASCSVVVFQQTAALALQPIITGDYRDRFVKMDNVWRFSERRIANDLFGNLSAHGRYAITRP